MAVQLGLAAGRILATAVANGVVLSRVRPEYMWTQRYGDRFEVTGLSGRGDAFFAKSRPDMVTHPVFERFYFAPETYMEPADDRSVVFTLATMIAE